MEDMSDEIIMKWREVKSEPPERCCLLLIATEYGDVMEAIFDREWVIFTEDGKTPLMEEVTHWMPMPPPPGKEQEDVQGGGPVGPNFWPGDEV